MTFAEMSRFLYLQSHTDQLTKSELVSNGTSLLSGPSGLVDDISRYTCTLWIILLFLVSTFLWRQYYEQARDPNSKLALPPGSFGLPIFGETLSFLIFGADYYLSRREKYGNIYKTHVLGQPAVRVIGAENIRNILMGEHITVESSWPKSTKCLMGPGGLLNASPDSHRIRKRLLLQALSPTVVSEHVPQIQEMVRSHLESWCNKGEQLGSSLCKQMSMSLATSVLIGFSMDHAKLQSIIGDSTTFLRNLFSLPWNIPGTGLWKGLQARERLVKEIKERLLTETSQWSLVDELKKLDETTTSLTPDEMADAILELWFAGNDTTSSTACSALLALGKNVQVQRKIEEELSKHGLLDPQTDLTLDRLDKLTYVENVVKEVVRLYPPVGGGFRRAKKTLEIGGYQIPKGWKVIYSIRDTHQTTPLFEQREEFLPERWVEMNEKTREIGQKFHYLPFGAGARSCPGEKFAKIFLKIFIVELIRTCTWELKNKNPKILYFPITHPADKLPVTFILKTEVSRIKPNQRRG